MTSSDKKAPHLKGPWWIEEERSRDGSRAFISSVAHGAFAEVVVKMEDSDRESESLLSNARVIAAAPDLVAAADAVLKHFMPTFNSSLEVDSCLVQLAAAYDKATS